MKNIDVYTVIRRLYVKGKLPLEEVKLAREYLFYPGGLLSAPLWQKQFLQDWKKCMKIINLVYDIRTGKKK